MRQALSDKSERKKFFDTLKARLPGKTERGAYRDLALTLANDLTRSDGETSTTEATALAELKSILSG